MKLSCPRNPDHKNFVRQSFDDKGRQVNLEMVDQFGRFLGGDPLDLYTGDVSYRFYCALCGQPALENHADIEGQ